MAEYFEKEKDLAKFLNGFFAFMNIFLIIKHKLFQRWFYHSDMTVEIF